MGIIKNIAKRIVYGAEPIVGRTNESFRIQWVEKTLKSIAPGKRLLDAGAGEQQYRKFCGHLNYVSQDFAQYDPGKLDSGLQMKKWDYGKLDIVSDIASIPEPDHSFDVILCTEVFEHIINPREAVREFSRLIKPGGELIITAPFCSMTHFAPYHFYTGFSRYFYETELPANGFEIVEMTPNGNYFEYIAQELIRVPSMGKKYAGKRPNIFEIIFLHILLKMLKRFSVNNKNSEELLTYGWHVRAIRKS